MSEIDFKIKFRGTRGSYPKPKSNFLKYGGNTACVEVHCGNRLIILDCGTGIIDVGSSEIQNSIILQDNKPHLATVILSHVHQDHIQGLQFYKPLFMPNSKIELYGLATPNEELKDTLKAILFDKVFPVGLDEIRSNFTINNFTQNEILILSQDGLTKKIDNSQDIININNDDDIIISAYKTNAHPKNGCLCIKIEYKGKSLVYATDKESYVGADKRFVQFAHNCDMLIHDAQYTYQDYVNPIQPKQGFGHSTFEMALDSKQQIGAKKLVFFHYDPRYNDEKLDSLAEEYASDDAIFAYEGLELDLFKM